NGLPGKPGQTSYELSIGSEEGSTDDIAAPVIREAPAGRTQHRQRHELVFSVVQRETDQIPYFIVLFVRASSTQAARRRRRVLSLVDDFEDVPKRVVGSYLLEHADAVCRVLSVWTQIDGFGHESPRVQHKSESVTTRLVRLWLLFRVEVSDFLIKAGIRSHLESGKAKITDARLADQTREPIPLVLTQIWTCEMQRVDTPSPTSKCILFEHASVRISSECHSNGREQIVG